MWFRGFLWQTMERGWKWYLNSFYFRRIEKLFYSFSTVQTKTVKMCAVWGENWNLIRLKHAMETFSCSIQKTTNSKRDNKSFWYLVNWKWTFGDQFIKPNVDFPCFQNWLIASESWADHNRFPSLKLNDIANKTFQSLSKGKNSKPEMKRNAIKL